MTCLMALTMQAQEEHLKFMGIPIDGSIKSFQKELKEKGFSRESSKDGYRTYEGDFAGEKVELWVYFDKSSRIVYQVGVIIPCYYERIARNKYRELKWQLMSKYNAAELSTYAQVYKNSGELLEKSIKSGYLNSLNWSKEYQKENGTDVTEIYIGKPVLNKYEGVDTLSFATIMMESWGNVGSITIKTTKIENYPFSVNFMKYENCVAIIYCDSQNDRKARTNKEDDL